jgi:hypothetical protein
MSSLLKFSSPLPHPAPRKQTQEAYTEPKFLVLSLGLKLAVKLG